MLEGGGEKSPTGSRPRWQPPRSLSFFNSVFWRGFRGVQSVTVFCFFLKWVWFNSRWFGTNSSQLWDNPSGDADAVKRGTKTMRAQPDGEIWVLPKLCAGSCHGNGFFCFSLELNGYCPALCWFFCLCAHVLSARTGVCMCVCVCGSAWKGKRMRANWVSQEAGLQSDLISVMCDQCEWEPGTQKASVATQLSLLQTMLRSPGRRQVKTPSWRPFPPRRPCFLGFFSGRFQSSNQKGKSRWFWCVGRSRWTQRCEMRQWDALCQCLHAQKNWKPKNNV